MFPHIIRKAIILPRAARPLINVHVASDGTKVGICDGVNVGICVWDGAIDGGQTLMPHEAPKQKTKSEAESLLFHLQRF